ncbi:MAG TPA: carboxypeptidase-like regulatory domain-containing protein [Bryobacteraceae bacterium]|nr:carboxypeptidase-like regulatory domain-containing protein [Bryobacteraceae bacterium]
MINSERGIAENASWWRTGLDWRAWTALTGLTLGLLLATSVRAGDLGAGLSGQISDHGLPVSGAIVTVDNGSFLGSVNTDGAGRFTFEQLRPGRYQFRASAHGYAVFERIVTVRANSGLNRIEVKDLIPADQQTVSVKELATRRMAQN